jgi:hypothetical protein
MLLVYKVYFIFRMLGTDSDIDSRSVTSCGSVDDVDDDWSSPPRLQTEQPSRSHRVPPGEHARWTFRYAVQSPKNKLKRELEQLVEENCRLRTQLEKCRSMLRNIRHRKSEIRKRWNHNRGSRDRLRSQQKNK